MAKKVKYTEKEIETMAVRLDALRAQKKEIEEEETKLSSTLKELLPNGANVCGSMLLILKSYSRSTVDHKLARSLAEEKFDKKIVGQIWAAATKITETRSLSVTPKA